ncbi:AP2 domain transcription factor AP2IX-8 [Toxoplasma gondii p89]|uniref:AP2 domain transcription factor AP2IX-8 n=1 Tax=Toxoplasma gondii p89 TaxID=943119 RepID=A0A086JDW4_TOXGO|nr:AP2 domain transcription factor AP2IX-8 [Toxoplasma gondii p89]
MAAAACAGSVPSQSSPVVTPAKASGPFFSLSLSSTASQDSSPSAASGVGNFFPSHSTGMPSPANLFTAADSPSSLLELGVSAQSLLGAQGRAASPSGLQMGQGAPQQGPQGLGPDGSLDASVGSLDALGGTGPAHSASNVSVCQSSCFPGLLPPFNSGGAGMQFRGQLHMPSFSSDLSLGSQPGAASRAPHEGSFLPQLSGVGGLGGPQGFPAFSSFGGVDAARAALFFAQNSCPPQSLACQNGAVPQPGVSPGAAGPPNVALSPAGPNPRASAAVGAVGASGPESPGNFITAPQPAMSLFGSGPAGLPPAEQSHSFLDASSNVGTVTNFSMQSPTNYGVYPFGAGVAPQASGCPGPWPSSSLSLNPSPRLPSSVQSPEVFAPEGAQALPSLGVVPGSPGCPAAPPTLVPHSSVQGQRREGSVHAQPSLQSPLPTAGTVNRGSSPAAAGLPVASPSGADVGAGAETPGADTAESIPSNALPKKYSGIWFDPQQNCWRASWVCATSGKRKFRYFSAAKFGHRHALQLAKVTKERAVERKKIRLPSAASGRGPAHPPGGTLVATPKLDPAELGTKAFSSEKPGDSPVPSQQAPVTAPVKAEDAKEGLAPAAPAGLEVPGTPEIQATPCEMLVKDEGSLTAGPGGPQPVSDPPTAEGASPARDEDGKRPGGALDPVALAEKAREMLKVPGVYYDSARMIWRAFWHEGGRRVIRYFTVNKHGFQRAHELALLTRRQAAMAMQQRRRQLTAGLVLAVNCGTGPASPGTPAPPGSVESKDGAEKGEGLSNVRASPGLAAVGLDAFAGGMNTGLQTSGGAPHAAECVARPVCNCGQMDGMHAHGCQLLLSQDRGLGCAVPAAAPFLAPSQGVMAPGVPGAYPSGQPNYYPATGSRGVGFPAGAPRPGNFDPALGGAPASATFPPPSPNGTPATSSSGGGGGCRVDYLERVAQLPKEEQVEWSEELKAWVVTPFPQGSGLLLKGGARGAGSDKGEGATAHGTRLSRMADGREILKMFTIRKYGFRVAREMAIEWRNRRREKLRVESEQQQMLHLRHKAPGAKGTRDNAGGVAPGPAVPALDPVHAINTAPTPTGANPALQAETRRAASPSFSASTCSSNPSSPPNSSGPHQQNLRHLMVSATGTGFGTCDPSGLSSPFMQVNIPCVGGQKMPPETPSASASSLSGYSNPLSSPHLASQSPLFLQAPSGGPAGVVSPLSQFPTGLGPTPQAAPGGSLGTPQGAASAGLSGAGNSASSMVGGSVGLSATASGSGAFLEPPDARSSLPAGCGDLVRTGMGEPVPESGVLSQTPAASAASLPSTLGFVKPPEPSSVPGSSEVPSTRDCPANWLLLPDGSPRCPRTGEETGDTSTPFVSQLFDPKVGTWPSPQAAAPDTVPRPVGNPGAAGASGSSLAFFPSPPTSLSSSTSYPCPPTSPAVPSLPHSMPPCTPSPGDTSKKMSVPEKSLLPVSQVSVPPEGFGLCAPSEGFLPSSSDGFFLPPGGVPQAATAAATAAAAAALAGPPPSQLLLQQQREQQSRRRREGVRDDGAKKEEESEENGGGVGEEGSSVEAVGVMRNAVSHVLRNLQEVCIPGLLCSCSLESEIFNYLAARLDEWTKAVHAHRQLCASVLSNPKVEKAGPKESVKTEGDEKGPGGKPGEAGANDAKELSTDPATDPQAATMVLAPYLKLFAQCIRKNRLPNEMEPEVQVLLLDALVHLGALSGFGGQKPPADAAADGATGTTAPDQVAKGEAVGMQQYPKAVEQTQ